jgi:hypothetical protein
MMTLVIVLRFQVHILSGFKPAQLFLFYAYSFRVRILSGFKPAQLFLFHEEQRLAIVSQTPRSRDDFVEAILASNFHFSTAVWRIYNFHVYVLFWFKPA